MITFDEYFKLTTEAKAGYSFDKFIDKAADRYTYISTDRVEQALDNLSDHGGLKILSLPHIFSFEKLLIDYSYKITDVYGVEIKSSVLKKEVIGAARKFTKQHSTSVWLPYSYKTKNYVAATMSSILDGSRILKNTQTGEMKTIDDLPVNVIDLDYVGMIDESKLKDVLYASRLLKSGGLIFLTLAFRNQKTGYTTADTTIMKPFGRGEEKKMLNPAYKSITPSEEDTRIHGRGTYGLNAKKREDYVTYAVNVADYIANYFGKGLRLVPIYANPYKGGDKSQAIEMMRLIFLKR